MQDTRPGAKRISVPSRIENSFRFNIPLIPNRQPPDPALWRLKVFNRLKVAAIGFSIAVLLAPQANSQHINQRNGIRRVLLISIDGMHAVDFLNCVNGISTINNGEPYAPPLPAL